MIQNINNAQQLQALRAVDFGQQGNTYFLVKPQESDSFNGKTLLGIAAVAGAIIFRKNIGNMFKKYLPNFSKTVAENYTKLTNPVREFYAKHDKNIIIKSTKTAKDWIFKQADKINEFVMNLGKAKPKAEQMEFSFMKDL